MPNFNVDLEHGSVRGNIDQMHGCCGVAVLHNVTFHAGTNSLNDLFADFHKYLLQKPYTEGGHDHFGRAIYCMTDNAAGNITRFCESNGWQMSPEMFNHRSSNKIRMYWMHRRTERAKRSRTSQREDNREAATRVAPTARNAPRELPRDARGLVHDNGHLPEGAQRATRPVRPKRLVRRSFIGGG